MPLGYFLILFSSIYFWGDRQFDQKKAEFIVLFMPLVLAENEVYKWSLL